GGRLRRFQEAEPGRGLGCEIPNALANTASSHPLLRILDRLRRHRRLSHRCGEAHGPGGHANLLRCHSRVHTESREGALLSCRRGDWRAWARMVYGGHDRPGWGARGRRYSWTACIHGKGSSRAERESFSLFRNSALDDHGDFAWFGQHVVTMFDDHDQIHKGSEKRRFCGMVEYRKLVFNALAVNLTTAGIPCIYYGTEQAFDSGGQPSR